MKSHQPPVPPNDPRHFTSAHLKPLPIPILRNPPARWSVACAILSVPVFLIAYSAVASYILTFYIRLPYLRRTLLGISAALSLATVVFGIIGLQRTRNRLVKSKASAVIGLTLGCLGIIATLISLPNSRRTEVPSLSDARERAQRVHCDFNLRQIGQGIMLYAKANHGKFPPRLDLLITTADLNPEVFICPSSNDNKGTGQNMREILADFAKPGRCSYIYLGAGLISQSPAQTVVAYEKLENHDGDGINVLYADGTTTWLPKSQAKQFLANLPAAPTTTTPSQRP